MKENVGHARKTPAPKTASGAPRAEVPANARSGLEMEVISDWKEIGRVYQTVTDFLESNRLSRSTDSQWSSASWSGSAGMSAAGYALYCFHVEAPMNRITPAQGGAA